MMVKFIRCYGVLRGRCQRPRAQPRYVSGEAAMRSRMR